MEKEFSKSNDRFLWFQVSWERCLWENERQKACGFVVSASTWFAFLQIPPRISSDRSGQHKSRWRYCRGQSRIQTLIKTCIICCWDYCKLGYRNMLLFEEKQRRLKIPMETDVWLITQSSMVAASVNKCMWVGVI